MSVGPVFTDKVTVVPADWANSVTSLVYTVFNQAATVVDARNALGLGSMALQASNSINVTGGLLDGTVIGTDNPQNARFQSAYATHLTPTLPQELTTKQYVDTSIANFVQNILSGSVTPALLAGKVNKSGDVMTGPLTLYGDPQSPLVAATKQYVDLIPTNLAATGANAGAKLVGFTTGTVYDALTALTGNQNANLVYAGPATGAAAAPHFRALTVADLAFAGQANGVATLDANGLVPLNQLPPSVVGGLNYQGVWNASTNTPTLASGVGTKGFMYKVSVAGNTNLDGNIAWNVGDFAIYDGSAWDKITGSSSEVQSINGLTGAITIAQGNAITVTQVGNTITIATTAGAGSVQSVALSMPSIFAVSGSPVTSTGTLTATLAGQNKNTFFAGPTTGSSTQPTFRTIVGADLPPATGSVLGGVSIGNGLSVDVVGKIAALVTSVFGRVGDIVLTTADITGAGGAPIDSPIFTGNARAPTVVTTDNSTAIATTQFVKSALVAFNIPPATQSSIGGVIVSTGLAVDVAGHLTANMLSFNTRVGDITLLAADITSAGGALLASPAFTGNPTAPTQLTTDNSTRLATTAFVQNLVGSIGVSSFNTRTGAVTLQTSDLNTLNVAYLTSPAFNGSPTVPTPAGGVVDTRIVNMLYVQTITSPLAPLASPAFTGTPTAPTAATSDSSTTIATTAFVHNLVAASGVSTFNTRSGAVTLLAADITSAGGALLASPAFTGSPTAPTQLTGDNSTKIATTAFVVATVTALSLSPATATTLGGVMIPSGHGLTIDGSGNLAANVWTVAGRTGDITLGVADVTGAAPLDSPAFTGNATIAYPGAPNFPDQSNNGNYLANTKFVQTAVSGTAIVAVGTGATSTTGWASYPILNLAGTVTSATTLTLPASGRWVCINNVSGGPITLASTGSANIVIPAGEIMDVVSIGGNVYQTTRTGATQAFGDNSVKLATTAFVQTALGGLNAGVTTFNTRAGAVVLLAADITSAGGALLASPALTGTPTAPTASVATNTTQIATTAYVQNNLANYATLASPTFSGTVTVTTLVGTTQAVGDNSTKMATTAYVQNTLLNTVSVPLTNLSITLTNAQYGSQIIRFTGTLTASVVITLPTSGQWIFYNSTTGAFNVTLSSGVGAQYVVPQNESASVVSMGIFGIINSNIAGNVITPATTTTLGGVIVPNGSGITVDTLGNLGLTLAGAAQLGVVKQGSGITVAGDGTISANVVTVAGRTGTVVLTVADVTGAAPLANPTFTGVPAAPTAAVGTNTTQLATAAFVNSTLQGAAAINVTGGATTLTAAQYSTPTLILSGNLTSNATLTVPTTGFWHVVNNTTGAFNVTFTNGGTATQVVAQGTATLLVSNGGTLGIYAVSGGGGGVLSFNTRTGAVVLTAADVTGVGGALLASPAFTGTPTAPTAAIGTNTTQLASTAYVLTALQSAVSIPLTNANVTLAATQYGVQTIKLTGTLTGNVILTFPTTGQWTVFNNTTGAFTVTATNGTGATLVLPQSVVAEIVSDPASGVLPVQALASNAQIGVNVTGIPLVTNEVKFAVTRAFVLPVNLVGAVANCSIQSGGGSTATVNVYQYVGASTTGTQIGTITLTPGSASTFTTVGGAAPSFAIGDTLSYQFPTANMTDFACTLSGTYR